MHTLRLALILTALAVTGTHAAGQTTGRTGRTSGFTRAEATHLLNRAGFGGTSEQIDELVRMGRSRAVRRLLDGPPGYGGANDLPPFEVTLDERPDRTVFMGLTPDERRKKAQEYRRADRQQLERFRSWWIDRMVKTEHPLVEKMVLFWHGHFTSSYRDVRNSYHMILQNELFRKHALGNFGELLHAVARDPAMLEYLDNNRNRKGKPNENFAREVMELFTLGIGNYTEKDIKEAARAFTGWTFRGNEFVVRRGQHDSGKKTVLGRTGRLDGTDVLDLLLDHPAAGRRMAGRLIGYFVGPDAPKGMVKRYARLLRRYRWNLKPVLAALFNDREFYREEVMCSRIMGPVEFVVSLSRRLGVKPPPPYLVQSAALLGQSLLDPPNVKGWEGGAAWITTSTLLLRGNLASYLVTGISPGRMRRDFTGEGGAGMTAMQRITGLGRMIPRIGGRGGRWSPGLRIKTVIAAAGAETPEAIVDCLAACYLAVPLTDEARASLIAFCREAGTRASEEFRVPTEYRLKRMVRILLSLPEAQLN